MSSPTVCIISVTVHKCSQWAHRGASASNAALCFIIGTNKTESKHQCTVTVAPGTRRPTGLALQALMTVAPSTHGPTALQALMN